MATVLYAEAEERTPAPADIERLGRCFQEAERPEDLRWVRAEGEAHALLRWQWRADQLKAPGYPVWLLAQSASQLMLSDALERVSDCQADTCRQGIRDVGCQVQKAFGMALFFNFSAGHSSSQRQTSTERLG